MDESIEKAIADTQRFLRVSENQRQAPSKYMVLLALAQELVAELDVKDKVCIKAHSVMHVDLENALDAIENGEL